MNVPIKNITKVDTSKGVPVWTTNMCDIRGYADYYVSKQKGVFANDDEKREKIVHYKKQMEEITTLIKTNFTNNAEIGSNTILLSVSCINFLSLAVTHKCCISFVKHIFNHKFAGIAYTGAQTQKVVTITCETLIPAVLPFVLRDKDRIVSGYGVYACSVVVDPENIHSIGHDETVFLYEEDMKKITEQWQNTPEKEKNKYWASVFMPTKGDTLYHNYNPVELVYQKSDGKKRLYSLCALTQFDAGKVRDFKGKSIKLSHTPILTIETQNNTLVPFKDASVVLPFSVRRANSEGLVTTVYTTDMRKRPHGGYGGIDCEPVNKKTKTKESLTGNTISVPSPNSNKISVFTGQKEEIMGLYQSIYAEFKNNNTVLFPETIANLDSDTKDIITFINNTTNIDEVLTYKKMYQSLEDIFTAYAVGKNEPDKSMIDGFKNNIATISTSKNPQDVIGAFILIRDDMRKMNPSKLNTNAKAPGKKRV